MIRIKKEDVFEFGDFRFPGGLHVKDKFIPDLFTSIDFERATENFFDEIYFRFNDGEYMIKQNGSFFHLLIKVGSHDGAWSWVKPTSGKMWAKLDHKLHRLLGDGLFEELVDYFGVEDSYETQEICYNVAKLSLDRAVRGITRSSCRSKVVSAFEKPVYWELGKGIGGEI